MTDIKKAVDRFLCWPMPRDFAPDGYISFDRANATNPHMWPIGTNLFTADQAREMFEHCFSDELQSIRSAELPVERPDVYEFNIAHIHETGGITSTKYTKECKTETTAYKHFLTLLEKHKVDERTYYLCKWKFLPPTTADTAESELAALRARLMEPDAYMRSAGYGKKDYIESFKVMTAVALKEGE